MNGNAQREQLQQIAIGQIADSTTNPRKSFAGMEDLKASIGEGGIRVPLLVREREPNSGPDGVFTADEPQYELVCGARRLRAARELELEAVPCIVRELTDEEARETQIVENLQRADVHPVEEAEAFRELRDRLGSIPLLAARVGKSESYVAKSLRLLSLTLHSRDALRGGLITIAHALLLARLGEGEQNAALKWTLDRNAGSKTPVDKVVEDRLAVLKRDQEGKNGNRFYAYVWEPETVQKLKSHIEGGAGTKLSRAPWSLTADGGLLAGVPNCAECEKNTKANSPLFGDLDIGDPTCTDGACFQAKTTAFVQIKQAESGHEPKYALAAVPRLSWKSSSVKPSIVFYGAITDKGPRASMANPAKLLKYGQWIDAKKGSCPYVRLGVTADWSDSGDRGYMGREQKLRKPGELVQVCIAVGCKVHKKGYEGQKASTVENGKTQQEREVERAAQEKLEGQIKAVEPTIRKLVFQAIIRKLDGADALRIMNNERHGAPGIRNWIRECKPEISGDELEALTAFGVDCGRAISVNAYYIARGGVRDDRANLWKLAKQAGVNADQVAAKAFHDGLTPSLTVLYPKGVPWPGEKVSKTANKPAVKKPAKKAAAKKAAVKKPAPVTSGFAQRAKAKRIAATKPAKKGLAKSAK